MKKSIFYIPLLAVALFSLQSCFVAKEYSRPAVVDEVHFRTDSLERDSTTIATVSWREMFTDPYLIAHIERALENNIDIRVALQQIAVARAYYNQGKQGQLPTLNATGRATYQELARNSQFGEFFDGAITQYELSGTLSWEADIWGRIRSQKRAFEAGYLQSVAAHQAVKTELIANVAGIYFQLLALDEQLRIAEETIATRESSLETTRALKDAGQVTEVAVKQTEAQLYSAQALLVDLKLNIKLLENTMSILLGDAPHAIERGSLEDITFNQELSSGFPIQLLANRPDVRAAEFALMNAFELTNVARSNFYPTLSITATGGLQSLEFDELFSANSLFANVIGSLVQPVFNGRRIRTQYEVAQAQQEQAYLNFRRAVLTASREVSDALYRFDAAGEKIRAKSQEYESYNLATTYSEELLNNGLASYLEVLTARQNALNSQLDLINARLDRLSAVVSLYRALGGGWR
jgi:NodT family efflux transporter outer membrane factor (OMF) lipoprotein